MFLSTRSTRYRFHTSTRMAGLVLAGFCLASAAGCSVLAARGKNAEGVRLSQQARYHEAMRQFQDATYMDPTNPDGYYNLAATYHRLGSLQDSQADLKRAEDHYRMCLGHDPNHTECYRGLAVLLSEQDRRDEAFRLIEGWVDRQPGSADAKIELARLNEESGDRTAAREHLVDALGADPRNPRALAALGKIREDMGETAEALRVYQRSIKYDNRQPQVASRIAALQSTMTPALSITVPGAPTRLVEGESTSLR